MLKQCLLKIRLLQKAVGVVAGFGRVTKTQHVASNHPVLSGERLP
jgi:hypothetical protein